MLTPDVRYKIFDHIRENAIRKNIEIDCINGWEEHIHCLIKMDTELSVGKVMQLIKGESAFWINKHSQLFPYHFGWADEYYAGSVDPLDLNRVREYIRNQETHHSRIDFKNELGNLFRDDKVAQVIS